MSATLMSSKRALGREVVGFSLVGLIGFVVHGVGLTVLMRSYHVGPDLAWGAAFALAVLVTWVLNRSLVFRVGRNDVKRIGAEYGLYLLVQLVGTVLSFGVFRSALFLFPALNTVPIVALAAGAFVALWFNFVGVRAVVFTTARRMH